MADISLEAVTGKLNRVGYEAFIQALRMAQSLLHSGAADSVLLGGLFRSFPVLCFAEARSGNAAERAWLGRGGQHNAPLVERAGFMVLRRGEVVMEGDVVTAAPGSGVWLPRGPYALAQAGAVEDWLS